MLAGRKKQGGMVWMCFFSIHFCLVFLSMAVCALSWFSHIVCFYVPGKHLLQSPCLKQSEILVLLLTSVLIYRLRDFFFSFFFFWGLTSPSSQSAWLVLLTLVLPVLALKAETVWKSQIPAAAWDLHRWVMEQTKRGSPFLQKQTLEWLHNSVLQWFF